MSSPLPRLFTAAAAAALLLGAVPGRSGAQYSGPKIDKPLPDSPRSGKFRFTINGFTVNSPTRDILLNTDGVGDEVFLSAAVIVVDTANGISSQSATVESKVYGEDRRDVFGKHVWPERSAGGEATKFGGLLAGNTVPYSRDREPWKRGPGMEARGIPLEVWCGTLTEGRNAVVVVPTIWEWDGPTSVLPEFASWANKVATDFANDTALAKSVGVVAAAAGTGAAPAAAAMAGLNAFNAGNRLVLGGTVELVNTGLVGAEADRPIGVKKVTRDGRTTHEFTPEHRFVLNYRTADYSTRADGAGVVGGFGVGVWPIEFRDDPFYQGRYTLYVQVERMDGKQCAHEWSPAPRPKP